MAHQNSSGSKTTRLVFEERKNSILQSPSKLAIEDRRKSNGALTGRHYQPSFRPREDLDEEHGARLLNLSQERQRRK